VLWITLPPAEKLDTMSLSKEVTESSVYQQPFHVLEVENRVGGTVLLHDGSMFENPAENSIFSTKQDAQHLESMDAQFATRLMALARNPEGKVLPISVNEDYQGKLALKNFRRRLISEEEAGNRAKLASLLWDIDESTVLPAVGSPEHRIRSDMDLVQQSETGAPNRPAPVATRKGSAKSVSR
jgi:hypothetical protein